MLIYNLGIKYLRVFLPCFQLRFVSALGVVLHLGDENLSVRLTKTIIFRLPTLNIDMDIQKATSGFAHLEMIRLNFSSPSFVIHVNLLHP